MTDGARVLKRGTDLALALLTVPLWVPLTLLLAALVWAIHGQPVFFRQIRVGRGGRRFVMCKLRTMTDARDGDGRVRPDGERITRLGRWLRRNSLDELPELVHVVRGEMSLVGPRPLLPEYLPLYSLTQARRHEVRPGITGWAQVNGRNTVPWDSRLAMDVWYIDHWSCRLDVMILAMTVKQVISQTGIAADGEATMTRFAGGDR